jgi:outer membrane immunogenic protein
MVVGTLNARIAILLLGGDDMQKQFLVSAAALAIAVATCGPVSAADMPVKGVAPAALFNWTGWYVGGHLGYGTSKFASEISQPGESQNNRHGLVGGLQLGYNYQTGNIVWGIEGDISGAGFSSAISDNAFHTDLLASIRGRLGIAFDRTLVYATGGWAHVSGKVISSGAGFSNPFRFNKNRPVWGGGIAYAATNNLSYRIEFLDYVGSQNIGGEDSGGNKLKDIKLLRVGVDYKFGGDPWGKGPVAAGGMPVKGYAPVAFNWSGFYIGGHLGYGASKFASEISQPGEDRKGKGAVGGLQLGYNIQNGNIVWGIEGDISGAGLGTAISDNAFKTDLLASIRGRLGIAFDRTLVYATGGYAYVAGQITSSSQGTSNPFKFHKYRPVVGGGIAYAATPNLIYRVEVLDYLGSQNIVDPGGDGNKLKDVWVARVGFDYKFDSWGKGPVVAKY